VKHRAVPARKGGGRIRTLRIQLSCKVRALETLSCYLGQFGTCCGAPVIGARKIRDEYERIAFATMGDFIDRRADGSTGLVLPHADAGKMATLSALVIGQHIDRPDGLPPAIVHMTLKLADKQRALRALSRYTSWIPSAFDEGIADRQAADDAAVLHVLAP
jgi:hypothetical protein